MQNATIKLESRAERRRFLKNVAAGGAISAGLLATSLPSFGQEEGEDLIKGDVAILRFWRRWKS